MIKDKELVKLIFGLKIKYLRRSKNLSYKDLAGQTGIGLSYIHEIEKGKKYPKYDKIIKLAEVFEVDYDSLVSTTSTKHLRPILDLIKSDFFKVFPLDSFGIDRSKLIEMFLDAPDRVNALVSTLETTIRSYHMTQENFYLTALRSYQNIQNNYFEDVEKSAIQFKKENKLKNSTILKTKKLIDLLKKNYEISIDDNSLNINKALNEIRSFYNSKKNILFLNSDLSDEQIRFLVAREIGFQYLNLEERPYETRIIDASNYEKLLSNFKASYFAVALLLDESAIIKDMKTFFQSTKWNPDFLLNLLKKNNVTPEMLFQRLTNILPKHFGINDLFFLRLHSSSDLETFAITKELHLSQLHEPYTNYTDEKYCRRWISIEILKKLRMEKVLKKPYLADGQISDYHDSDNAYLLLSIAKKNHKNTKEGTSVNLGLKINKELNEQINFLKDPNLKTKLVHTTCQRCSISDCSERTAYPEILEKENELIEIESALRKL